MLFRPACVICGTPVATIEVIPPNTLPAEWSLWEEQQRKLFTQYRKTDFYYLIYSGPGGGNGWVGDRIDPARADLIVAAFSGEPDAEAIRAAGFYDDGGFCLKCSKFYCPTHWNISTTGGGWCPEGHFKSLDPHWSPE